MKLLPALPNRTGGFPASGFPVSGSRWAGSGTRRQAFRSNAPAAQARTPLTPFRAAHWSPSAGAPARCTRTDAQPCGTTSALGSGVPAGGHHHLPTSLRSTIVTRFLTTTDALTPTGPCVAASRGSLIHGSLTSNHAVSNHLRCSHSRVPLSLRCGHYFVRAARSFARKLAKPPTESSSRCGGATATALRPGRSLPEALHPGVSPRGSFVWILALQCRPGQGLSPGCQ